MENGHSGSNVVSMAAAESAILSKRYTEVFNLIYEKWANVLSLQEGEVLRFINIRTYKYGKAREYVPAKHFLRGVRTREGELLHTGINLGRTTLKKALRGLEEIGLITAYKEEIRKGGKNEANRFEINFKTLQQGPEMASKLCVPRKNRRGSRGDTGGVAIRHSGGRDTNPNKHIDNKQILNSRNKAGADAPAQAGTLEENIGTATQQTRSRRRKKVESLSYKVTQAGIKALWEELCTKHYSHVPYIPMSRTEWAIFKRQHDSMKLGKTSIKDVMTWVVDNWEEIMSHESLRWIGKKEKIEVPSLIVLAKYLRHYVDQYRNMLQGEHKGTWAHRTEKREKRKAAVSTPDETSILKARLKRMEIALAKAEDDAGRSSRAGERLAKEVKQLKRKLEDAPVEDIDYDSIPDLPEWGESGDE